MADEDVRATGLLEHGGRDLSRIGPLVLPEEVLGTEPDVRTGEGSPDIPEGSERGDKDHAAFLQTGHG
jgi:hypothetical protein